MSDKLNLRFGALAESLDAQLAEQGLQYRFRVDADLHQRLADAITLLAIQGTLSSSEVGRARKRLLKQVAACVRKSPPKSKNKMSDNKQEADDE